MIVSELSPGAIGGAIKGMSLDRQTARRRAVELYQGVGMDDEVRQYFAPEALRQASVDCQKIAARFVNKRFSVYQAPPERHASADDYAALQGNLDPVFVTVERLTGLLGTMATIATVTEARVMHYLPLVEFEPVWLPDDPEPYGIAYPLFHASANGQTKREDLTWIVWTDALHFQCSGRGAVSPVVGPDGSVNDQFVNPYGVTPVVYSHREADFTGSWWRPIDTALLTTQRSCNVLGVQGNLGAMFQALGQSVISGADKADVALGPDKTLFLPRDATYDMVAPPGGLAQIEAWVRWKLDSLAASMGLAINWAGEMGATSGEHQRMKEIELTTSIMADFPLWAQVEQERHRVARAVYQYHFGVDFGEDLSVNFTEPNIPQSEEQMRAEWEFEFDKGLASLQDYYRRKDPSATDDQIAERIAKVQAERTEAPGPARVAAAEQPARPAGGLAALLARRVDEEQ